MKLKTAHVSMQFADSRLEHHSDAVDIFHRAVEQDYAWITGTEAGPGSNNTGEQLIKLGRLAGYKVWVPQIQGPKRMRNTDCWIAVKRDLIVENFRSDYVPVIPSSQELYQKAGVKATLPRWGEKGLVTVSFDSIPQLGEINILAAHSLTGAHHEGAGDHGVNRWDLNLDLDNAIGKWMKDEGRGTALAFAALDRNESDRAQRVNIPNGTTLADELEKWQNTGHGDIDWMLSYDKDKRVTGANFRVLDDSEFKLFGDHYFLEGLWDIEPLKADD